MTVPAPWTRVAVVVGGPADDRGIAAELAADALWQHGAAGVEEQDHPGGLRLVGGFAQRSDATRAAAAVGRMVVGGATLEVTESTVDDDGLDGWRAWAEPERAGRFWIVPAWVDVPDLDEDEVAITIDPGRTFGSGSHPTTRLVLGALDQLVAPGDRVLDVGTGSGVLAIGAARRDAAEVVAIDVDASSPTVAAANAERNGVADLVRASDRPLAAVVADAPGRWQVVLANLLAPVIAELGPDLVRAVAPGGALVASGLLEDRWEASLPHLEPLVVEGVDVEDGWAAITLRRPPDEAAEGTGRR